MGQSFLLDKAIFEHDLRDALSTLSGVPTADITDQTFLYKPNPSPNEPNSLRLDFAHDPVPGIVGRIAMQRFGSQIWSGGNASISPSRTYSGLVDEGFTWLDHIGDAAVLRTIQAAIPDNNALPADPLPFLDGTAQTQFIRRLESQTNTRLLPPSQSAPFSSVLQTALLNASTVADVFDALTAWVHDHLR